MLEIFIMETKKLRTIHWTHLYLEVSHAQAKHLNINSNFQIDCKLLIIFEIEIKAFIKIFDKDVEFILFCRSISTLGNYVVRR